ncbi:hypothetical protein DFP94_101200 [Fontibacillus phaseoli]|uniref:Uncharacterized protein n=1 Tax=Fontibacillus phaseoli TaxID=1416533 RepID=A0A369BM18_9BACL|nr:hypothetical protein [Fontibacillus phaseoli]RCX22620.1 hypothetical protein DFP94_101200 [Fontibacillus phaseoli]
MLPDLDRKLLRILFNFSIQRRRMPMMGELERMTGRRKEDILEGLRALEREQYIHWPDPPQLQDILVLEAWDRGIH